MVELPESASTQHLFYNVAHTAVSAGTRGNVARNLFDFGGGVAGTARTSTQLHDFVVGYVVTHVQNLFGLQSILAQQVLEDRLLDATAQVDLLNAELMIAMIDGWTLATGDDGDG